MSDTTSTILLVAVGICLVLSLYPNRIDLLATKPQLPKQSIPFTYTNGLNEQMVIGCANGILFQQGSQAIDITPTDIRFVANQEVLRVTQSGNVGIGITNPTSKLHVTGEIALTNGNLKVNSGNLIIPDGSKIGIGTTAPASNFHVHGGNLLLTNGGKLGIGTTSPQDTISLPSDATVNLGAIATKLNTTTQKFDTYLYGNVGFGTSTLDQPFQICADGNSLLNEWDTDHSLSLSSLSGGANPIQMFIDTDATNQCSAIQSIKKGVTPMPLLLNPRGGYVGIGTTNPVEALTVNGNIKAERYYVQSVYHNFVQTNDKNKWFKIASFSGITYGEFLLSWSTSGHHGEIRFNASCSYNQHSVINIVGATFYNALIDYIRISTDNASIYNTNFIEIHFFNGDWYNTSIDVNITLLNTGPLTGNMTVLPSRTDGTSSGYTYYPSLTVCSFSSVFNTSSLFFNGNLGINTQSPAYTIDAVSTNPSVMRLTSSSSDTCLDLVNTGSGGMPWRIGSAGAGSGGGSGNFYIYGYGATNPGVKMVITPSGQLGIGTTIPSPNSRIEAFSASGGSGDNYITARHIAGGDSWTTMRLINNTGSACYWFLNSSERSADGGANTCTLRNDCGALRLQCSSEQSTFLMSGPNTTLWTGQFSIHAPLTVHGATTVNGSFTANGGTFNSSVSVNGNSTVNGLTTFNGASIHNGRIVVQNSVNGGSSRGIWMWNEGDPAWGIYMATSGGGAALNDGTAPAGSGFSSHSIRFRVGNYSEYGFVFENSSNQLLASIRASDGYSYFPTIATNSVTADEVYTNDWFRVRGGGGVHWDSYGQGIQATLNGSSTYGTVSTYGVGRNGWAGWSINDWGSLMGDGTTLGLHHNTRSWIIRGDLSNVTIGSDLHDRIYLNNNVVFGQGFTANSNSTINGIVKADKVGVGMDPVFPLDVNGGIRTSTFILIGNWQIISRTSELHFLKDGNHMNSILSDGNVWRTSDINLKSGIKALSVASSIQKIMGLEPVSYIHKYMPEVNGHIERSIGFIAQEVQKVNPYCVSEKEHVVEEEVLDEEGKPVPELNENGEPVLSKEGKTVFKKQKVVKDKKLGMCYDDLYIHAINVIKEHHKILESQDSTLSSLEQLTIDNQAYIQNLSDRLSRLEKLVMA